MLTLQEAFTLAKNDLNIWFRPLSWKGTRTALCVHPNLGVTFVPTNRGGHRAHFPSYEEVMESWEALPAAEILEE